MTDKVKPHVSSDPVMKHWPLDLDSPRDQMLPYPCQTCHEPFRSCKKLATHKCKGARIVAYPGKAGHDQQIAELNRKKEAH